ncbi:MAG TPA: class I SAM-dependent rRNA methyltransferase [Vicinamibacterales bacterium]|nr:class I SAM-dependent rRNA methyltransferase [Vicinamibacterales bacterium]
MPTVTVSSRGEQRIRGGHPWVYRTDVTAVDAGGGDFVEVLGPRGRPVGTALFSDRSQITIRMLTVGQPAELPALIHARLERAIAFRESLSIDANTYRLVHGEADLLPSLIVDRYADYVVMQALSQGMDRVTPLVVASLTALLRPLGILARNDPKVRALEGLEQRVDVLAGEIPPTVAVREGPVEYAADLRHGQKTGLFLDQRENREAAARYARGRLLDCFSYHGGFALRLAPQCDSAEAVDISADAVAHITANAARNSLPALSAREANVFDELRRLERAGERYDTIVLDPPAFAKNKASVPNAIAGYKDINLHAMRLLAPGGCLVSCSCSYNVSEDLFGSILHEASVDSHVPMTVVEKRMQGRDHPVLLGVAETHYLKCFILRRVE